MPKKGYKSVTIPEELYELIQEVVRNKRQYGYGNVSEFVREAIREKLKQIGILK